MSGLSRRFIRSANILAVACVVAPLLVAFRLWRFSYFWTDDFGNIFWIQSERFGQIVGHIVNPLSTFYRPTGLLLYEILYRSAGMNPAPYHLVAWTLHAINTALLFLLLSRILQSPFAAAAGAIPFAFRVNFADIYWSFGTIFELLACCLMFTGMLLYIRRRPGWRLMIGLTAIYILAIKSKEMAISLVAVWILYDVCLRRRLLLAYLALPVTASVWFAHLRIQTMRNPNPLDPYYMDLRLQTVIDGFGQYFTWLYGLRLPPVLWSFLLVAGLIVALRQRNRLATFFMCYTLVAFAPVIFLVNHRWPYFWYIPFFGISGLFGLGAKYLRDLAAKRIPLQRLILINLIALAFWSSAHVSLEYIRSARTRAYEAGMAVVFESFVSGLRALESPEPGATLFFTEMPPHFHAQVLNAAVQVILARPDLHARFVAGFPPDAKWKLKFSDRLLQRVGAQ